MESSRSKSIGILKHTNRMRNHWMNTWSIAPDDFILSLPGFMPNSYRKSLALRYCLPTWGRGSPASSIPILSKSRLISGISNENWPSMNISILFMKLYWKRTARLATEDLQGNGQELSSCLAEKKSNDGCRHTWHHSWQVTWGPG